MLRVYTVQPGDSLTGIALRLFGTMSRWTDILRANPGKVRNPDESAASDPSRNILTVGTDLVIPGSGEPVQPPPSVPTSSGDSMLPVILLLLGSAIVLYFVLNSKKGKRK